MCSNVFKIGCARNAITTQHKTVHVVRADKNLRAARHLQCQTRTTQAYVAQSQFIQNPTRQTNTYEDLKPTQTRTAH